MGCPVASAFQLCLGHDPEVLELPEGNVNVVVNIAVAFVILVVFLVVLLAGFAFREAVNLALLESFTPPVIMWN